jgi:hypothetical protein
MGVMTHMAMYSHILSYDGLCLDANAIVKKGLPSLILWANPIESVSTSSDVTFADDVERLEILSTSLMGLSIPRDLSGLQAVY